MLAELWDWPDSELAQALCRVASAWRQRHYSRYFPRAADGQPVTVEIYPSLRWPTVVRPRKAPGHTENAYLADFDHDWLCRRLLFVADQLAGRCCGKEEVVGFLENVPGFKLPKDFRFEAPQLAGLRARAESLAEQLAGLERELREAADELKSADQWKLEPGSKLEPADYSRLSRDLQEVVACDGTPRELDDQRRMADRLLDDPRWAELFDGAMESLKKKLIGLQEKTHAKAKVLLELAGKRVVFDQKVVADPARLADSMAAYFFRYFEQYDLITYPLLYGTGGKEGARVEILRISPEDADTLFDQRHLGKPKLAGTGMAHFAGFLDPQWRRSDRVWGRLDAAERIVTALVPDEEKRRVWLDRLHGEIAGAELGEKAEKVLGDLREQAEKKEGHEKKGAAWREAISKWWHQRLYRHDLLIGWIHELPAGKREKLIGHLMAQAAPSQLGLVLASQTEQRGGLPPERQLALLRRATGVLTDVLSRSPGEEQGPWTGKAAKMLRSVSASLAAVFALTFDPSPWALGFRRLLLVTTGLSLVASFGLFLLHQREAGVEAGLVAFGLLTVQFLLLGVKAVVARKRSGVFFTLFFLIVFLGLALYGGYQIWVDRNDILSLLLGSSPG